MIELGGSNWDDRVAVVEVVGIGRSASRKRGNLETGVSQ